MKTLTLHPQGKSGVNIATAKYEQVRDAILASLSASGPVTHAEFLKDVQVRLEGFDGSINWYVETVKLDLEARDLITHDRKSRLINLV